MVWKPDSNKENLGYPKPEEFENMTQDQFEKYCNSLSLAPTQYEYAKGNALSNHFDFINTELEKVDMEGFPTVSVNKDLELGWFQWGERLMMKREDYEDLYESCRHNWSRMCESPIECILLNEVKKIELNPIINLTLGEMLLKCKRDIAGRFTEGAGERYDQVYMTIDGDRPVPILIVECDGEADHNNVKDIKKDAKKEYNLSYHFPYAHVLRFTGSEINNSSKKCASIIKTTFDFLCSIYPQLKANPDMVEKMRNTAIQRFVKSIE
ncbi:hypothetical protein [Chengkuizengella axinellae]|uniref:DUF2726 domain-containing protein n=1 Tax=Chengkuizengella axinellae TaxID=3064388 RepID=A0ABT9J3N6_9BACL|nr:hypothetical protein [Chengkuizengella sp. 2205SS18-9]MDP5276214.1 hypothetical protein [Chengkuizengella sp. 2205SS18-9]